MRNAKDNTSPHKNKRVTVKGLSPVTRKGDLLFLKVKINDVIIVEYCERFFEHEDSLVIRDDEFSWMKGYGAYKVKKLYEPIPREMSLEDTGLMVDAETLHFHIRKFLKMKLTEQSYLESLIKSKQGKI